MVPEPGLETLSASIQTIFFDNLVEISAISLAIYDYVVTFDQEVKLIWMRNWSLGKGLFLLIRYLTIAYTISAINLHFSEKFLLVGCINLRRFETIVNLLIALVTEAALQLRVYALYGGSRRVGVVLSLVLFVCTMVAVSVTIMELRGSEIILFKFPAYNVCFLSKWAPYEIYFLTILADEILLFGMVINKCVHYNLFGLNFIRGALKTDPVTRLILDSLLYFLLIFAAYAGSLFVWIYQYTSADPAVLYTILISSIMSQRILLNIRQVCDVNMPSTASQISPSTLIFEDMP